MRDFFYNIVDAISGPLQKFNMTIPSIKWTDVIEILIIAMGFYYIMTLVRNSRAWTLFRGILVVIIFFLLAALFQMDTILWLGGKLVNVAMIALIVVFQQELRNALEHIGSRKLWRRIIPVGLTRGFEPSISDNTINEIVRACFEMGAVKTGALIVIQDDVGLNEYERTGIEVDATLTRQLLINIFEKNTPLHDGAVIVSGNRVTFATCYLPLSDNKEFPKEFGTRHRAALGISEKSDAFTIIVSEETGKVSFTRRGEITTDVTADELTAALKDLQNEDMKDIKKGGDPDGGEDKEPSV